VTKIGLVVLILAALCLATILVAQFVRTGSFARGDGFVLGLLLAFRCSTASPARSSCDGGGIVDSIRFVARKGFECQGSRGALSEPGSLVSRGVPPRLTVPLTPSSPSQTSPSLFPKRELA